MFKSLFQSIKKSSRLRKVSKKLSKPFDLNNMFKNGQTEDTNLDELISIAEDDQYVKFIIDEYNIDEKTLKGLYEQLILAGAGQYAAGHYIAASSLVYPFTLKFLIENFNGEIFSIKDFDHYNASLFISNRLYEYFKNGEAGEVHIR